MTICSTIIFLSRKIKLQPTKSKKKCNLQCRDRKRDEVGKIHKRLTESNSETEEKKGKQRDRETKR